MPSSDDNMYPITLEQHMGPLMWTPIGENEILVSKEVSYYNWRTYQHETLSESEMSDFVVIGCRGCSPHAIDIVWSEPARRRSSGSSLRTVSYSECILADALSLRELLDIFASSYARDGRLPPVGMTLRCILADQMARKIRLEFKSDDEVAEKEVRFAPVEVGGTGAKKRLIGSELCATAHCSAVRAAADKLWTTADILCAGLDMEM